MSSFRTLRRKKCDAIVAVGGGNPENNPGIATPEEIVSLCCAAF